MAALFNIISIPFGYVIKFCNALVNNNYLFALLLFAVIIEVLLIPFGIKQQKNTIKQASLRPKEMAIRKKYAGRDDNPTKQKMTQEIQDLYQKEGYNPMGGCLPLVIQFPILIALYNIVMNPLKYICNLEVHTIEQIKNIVEGVTGKTTYTVERNIELLSDMQSLSWADFANVEGFTEEMFNNLPNLKLFGGALDLGAVPTLGLNWLLLVPILTFLSYFFSMKMTRKFSAAPVTEDKATGCSNKMMDLMMPLMSVYIAFIVPAAIGVYWIFKSLLGVAKQVILHYAMPTPKFTEEDYKAAEKEMNSKQTQAPKAKSGKVVRSLHHIDDEDFEDTREAGIRRREALEAQAAEEEANRASLFKKPSSLGAPEMKDDTRAKENEKKANEKKTKEKKAPKSKYNQDPNRNNTSDGE